MAVAQERQERDPTGQEQGHINPPPPRDFNVAGWTETGRIRARASWFFGFAIIEELWECRDGRFEWRRIDGPISIRERI